jgi:transposase
VGAIVAATVLAGWSHPGRCLDEAAFAGTAPIPASSGQTIRYRLNRSGDRQLNRALHVITLTRLRYDARTRDFADRRRAKARPIARSSDASSPTSPASSTDASNTQPQRLDAP